MSVNRNKSNHNKKVIVGLSGGVDSSVSALILKELGYAVEALFMKNWDEDDGTDQCTAMSDLEDALRVSHQLGIACHTVSFSKEYWDRVFQHFLDEYAAGRTPNPDILCNKEIKFKAFADYAKTLGADYIATGHYAQRAKISFNNSDNFHWQLLRGSDTNKDQSYFLHAIPAQALAKTLFPVGGLNKEEVRMIAIQHKLVTHDKKDSTGICFIGERKFAEFLKTYLPAKPGNIVTEKGDIIGQHQGLMYHTIGQRQGLGIGGLKGYSEVPWYVIGKKLETNQLIVGQGNNNPLLFRQRLVAHKLEWLNPIMEDALHDKHPGETVELVCSAKIRYRQPDQPCRVLLGDNFATVEFKHLQRAVTPGQAVVFYDGLTCLGGGTISNE